MKFHVIMEEPAITEIERNARWWAEHHSSHQALVWYDAAVDAIYSLESQPERHALSPENQQFDYEIRELLFGIGSRPSYRAVFTIQGNSVHVLTVRRAAQDAVAPEEIPGNGDIPVRFISTQLRTRTLTDISARRYRVCKRLRPPSENERFA